MHTDPLAKQRIAMWSGPRNISTALMRSWENRSDTVVCDEPLYAHYLMETGLPHPGRDEVLASQDNDWRQVAHALTGEIPGGKRYYYQKHMAHHLLPGIGREWLLCLTNVVLIRDPAEMLTSLIKVTPNPTVLDTGFPQLLELFTWLRESNGVGPVVVDSRDVLCKPERHLRALCAALDVTFDPAMLSWPAGPRPTDGVWAKYWYKSVEASTGFVPYRPKTEPVPARLHHVLEACRSDYERLYASRLRSD
jgi:hypothetical protein